MEGEELSESPFGGAGNEIGSAVIEKDEQGSGIVPRIYVASLSDYNEGILHGEWITAAQEPEHIRAEIEDMLSRSLAPLAEEWAIHDFEGFNGMHLGEWEDLDYVSTVALGIERHGLAFAHWAQLVSETEHLRQFENCYRGRWDNLAAYAEELLDDSGTETDLDRVVPEWVRPYVTLDYAAIGRDMECDGALMTAQAEEGGVHVFEQPS